MNGDHRDVDIITDLLRVIGENPYREGLKDTPARVLRSLHEMTAGMKEDPAEILSARFTAETYDELVVVRDIEFWSLCEHHLLPFHGFATVGYLPNGKVVGLSKVARLVECFARRLQIQERMTEQIARAMLDNLQPRGVGVVLKATHFCMAMRGVRKSSKLVTSSIVGSMRENPEIRAEFLALARG